MDKENTRAIGERIFSLIASEYDSDAAFERALGLKDKTVNNWRRAKSASYMKMLPTLSERFSVNVGELLDMPVTKDTSELSDDEIELITKYRGARGMPPKIREAMKETILSVINLYVKTSNEIKAEKRREKKAKRS